MFFIAILIASTISIAGAAAYFSVYGLAYTFSGVFWSVVAMGASLEAGKLVAASYLYRYWNKTHIFLRTYLMLGVLALMMLTSVGIFGYLSSGYQQDVLPLKQKTEQVQLLEEEKARVLQRKQQIDNLMAGSATVSNVENAKGIDRNAVRALRETTRARESLVRQYKVEQKDVTARLKELDAELLILKQDLIKVEAHIGPITYIAKAFNFPTDDATKYLIFIIIFAFDPMAVALTLAVNIALRLRKEERDAKSPIEKDIIQLGRDIANNQQPLPDDMRKVLNNNLWDLYERSEPNAPVEEPIVVDKTEEPAVEEVPFDEDFGAEVEDSTEVQTEQPAVEQEIGSPRRYRPYSNMWTGANPPTEKLDELVAYYQTTKARIANGDKISNDEQWEMDAIREVLKKSGYGHYL